MTIQLDDLGALVGVLVGIATLAWRNRGVTAISGTDYAYSSSARGRFENNMVLNATTAIDFGVVTDVTATGTVSS